MAQKLVLDEPGLWAPGEMEFIACALIQKHKSIIIAARS